MGPFKNNQMKKVLVLVLSLVCISAFAQKQSKWIEVQCIDIPKSAVIKEGTTKTGNPKYWFEFSKIGNVPVSPGSAEKFKSGEVVLQLVKWQHKETGQYKYTTRQKKGKKQTLNIDLLTIFQQ